MMWTPLPPQHSGIADYSFELLEALSDIIEITAVTENPDTAMAPPAVPVVGPDSEFTPDTLHIYHMGNHAGIHSWIYQQALAVPGVVVLHDTSLLDFYAGHFAGIASPEFRDEVRPRIAVHHHALDFRGTMQLDPRRARFGRAK